MTRTKAEKIRKGIDNKIRKATVDMEWWADFWGFTVDEYEEFLDMAIKALEQEPKRGKWILDEEVSKKHIEPIYVCSACKNYAAWGDTEKTPFCPNCGARMEDGKE